MEFTVAIESPFNLDYTLESGQAFRWQNNGEWWYGTVPGGALKVRQEGEVLRCVSSSDLVDGAFARSYFRLDVPLDKVLASIMKDETINLAIQTFYGLRLMRQDRWECLASFVLATNSNIPRIKKMIQAVCARFGVSFVFEGVEYRAFPSPEALSEASISDLTACGLGYRASYLKRVAASVDRGAVDFSEVPLLGYEEARDVLVKQFQGEKLFPGVGPKVADCVLLYSFDMDEAFPIDVWIARQIASSYPDLLDDKIRARLSSHGKASLGRGDYGRISSNARRYFGRYAGYAQQYLFMMARSAERKVKL